MWTTIASYTSLDEAYIVKGMLEAHDIPVEVANATIGSVYPMTDTWAPIELQVPQPLAVKALALIEQHS